MTVTSVLKEDKRKKNKMTNDKKMEEKSCKENIVKLETGGNLKTLPCHSREEKVCR